MHSLVLVGASGHCRSVIDSLNISHYEKIGIIDNAKPRGEMFCGIPIIGNDDDAKMLFGSGYTMAIIAIGSVGSPINRIHAYKRYKDPGFCFPVIIDPTAIVSKNAEIGEGSFIGKGAIVNSGTNTGSLCIINTGAVLDHDCELGDFVHIAPNAALSGGVSVGSGSHLGTGASVIQGVRIGKNVIIGAGSVVTRDIEDGVLAVGVPCKPIKKSE